MISKIDPEKLLGSKFSLYNVAKASRLRRYVDSLYVISLLSYSPRRDHSHPSFPKNEPHHPLSSIDTQRVGGPFCLHIYRHQPWHFFVLRPRGWKNTFSSLIFLIRLYFSDLSNNLTISLAHSLPCHFSEHLFLRSVHATQKCHERARPTQNLDLHVPHYDLQMFRPPHPSLAPPISFAIFVIFI